jgi:hypothetical protein
VPRRNRRDPGSAGGRGAPPARADGPTWALVPGYDVRHAAGEKPYRCPGCDHLVRPGLWHLVVVPLDDPDDRRHWHTECWRSELRTSGPR